MRILVTGGTGFIGERLCQRLAGKGHKLSVLTRNSSRARRRFGQLDINTFSTLDEWTPDIGFDAIINLAGEPIMAKRWTEDRKRILWESRVTLTEKLVERIANVEHKPSVLISGSAVGIYGDQGDELLDEASQTRDEFGHQLCKAWEDSAIRAEKSGTRVCLLRTGLVVGKHGGFLERMLLPFKLGLGGKIGDGRQWMSWIHIDDHIALTEHLLTSDELKGPFNATAPNPVTNAEFSRTLASCLNRPALLHMPAWLLKLMLGEMAELLLGSQRVLPKKAQISGFKFSFETLQPALLDILTR